MEPNFASSKFVVEIQSEELANSFLKGLTNEGELISDLKKMPFGPMIGTARDKFGITWDIVVC